MCWDIGKLKIKKYGNINDYSMNVGQDTWEFVWVSEYCFDITSALLK